MLCKLFGVLCSFSHFCYPKFTKKIPAPFRPLLTEIGQNSAIKFFRPTFLFLAPFELFGRKFGHLAALRPNREKEPLPTILAIYLITLGTVPVRICLCTIGPCAFLPLTIGPCTICPCTVPTICPGS